MCIAHRRDVIASIRAVVSLRLPSDHTAAARARRFVAETLQQWELAQAIPDVELLTSELVTNAILHARSAATLDIVRRNGTVRVEVGDDSPTPPKLRAYSPDAPTGRGLVLVDRIASRWGYDLAGGTPGKCVWFELDIS